MTQKPDSPVSEKEMKATPALPRCVHCGGFTKVYGGEHARFVTCRHEICMAHGPLVSGDVEALDAYGKYAREEADALRDEIKVLKGKVVALVRSIRI